MTKIPICLGQESNDTLLKEFTGGQRDYIIDKLYPIIRKTLVHFIAEAKMQNAIQEREEIVLEIPETSKAQETTKSQPPSASQLKQVKQAAPKVNKTFNQTQKVSGLKPYTHKAAQVPVAGSNKRALIVKAPKKSEINQLSPNGSIVLSPRVQTAMQKSGSKINPRVKSYAQVQVRPTTASSALKRDQLRNVYLEPGKASTTPKLKHSMPQLSVSSPTSIKIQVQDLLDQQQREKEAKQREEAEVKEEVLKAEEPKLNYGGFGQKKEEPKQLNYGGFGQKKEDPAPEPQIQLNYGGFGQRKDEAAPENPRFNYRGFAQSTCKEDGEPQSLISPKPTFKDPSIKIVPDAPKGTFQNFSISQTSSQPFNPDAQFKASLLEVLGGTEQNARLFTMATATAGPGAAYLQHKRGSVFQKNVELHNISNFVAPVFPKSDQERTAILDLLKNIYLTKSLDLKDHIVLADAMQMSTYNSQEMILRYGDIGDKYFILAEGIVRVKVYEQGANPFSPDLESKLVVEKELNPYPQMIGFGEIALLMNSKRTASVIAKTDVKCWSLSADVFKYIIAQKTLQRRNINLKTLDQVMLFKDLEQYEKLKLIDGLQVQTYTQDQFVFHEGETGDKFFIIESGTCACLKVNKEAEGGYSQVRELVENDHFGEIAILQNVKRTLSVKATSDLKLLVLTRQAFNRILGSIRNFLKEDYKKDLGLDTSFESSDNEPSVQQNTGGPAVPVKQLLHGIEEEEGDD